MTNNNKNFFQINEEKYLDLTKPSDIIDALLWLSSDESKFIYNNHYILHYWKDEKELEHIEDFPTIRLEVNNFFKLLLSLNPNENLFLKYFQSPTISDNVKSIQLNYILQGIQKWMLYNWHTQDAYIFEFHLNGKILDADSSFRRTPENCLSYYVNYNLKGLYDFIWDFLKPYVDERKLEFDYFYSNKSKPEKSDSENDIEVPEFFKEKNTYNCFRNYSKITYSNARKFFGYAFQRMKNEKMIHNISHMEFASFLKEEQFISDEEYNEIIIANQFDTLTRSFSKSRELAFNISFKN